MSDLINTSEDFELEEPQLDEADLSISNELAKLQKDDATLAECFGNVCKDTAVGLLYGEMFLIKRGLLYRQSKEDGTQLVVPKLYHKQVVELGHSVPWSGHLGLMKTLMRISKRFYWPGMYSEVKDYCKACPECQLLVGRKPTVAPLVPIPAVNITFERIGVDVVGSVLARTGINGCPISHLRTVKFPKHPLDFRLLNCFSPIRLEVHWMC